MQRRIPLSPRPEPFPLINLNWLTASQTGLNSSGNRAWDQVYCTKLLAIKSQSLLLHKRNCSKTQHVLFHGTSLESV